MQQFLVQHLDQLASTPTVEELMEEVERRQELDRSDVPVQVILDAVDADRR